MNKEEIVWKRKFEILKSKIQELHEKVDWKTPPFEVSTKRAFVQANRIYVNFDYDVTDNLDYALENWGESHFDVFDLNYELSPKHPENKIPENKNKEIVNKIDKCIKILEGLQK